MKLSRPLVVLDLETTGRWVEKDKIIELGMIKRLPDGSSETYVKYVNPGMPIPASVTEITGIKDEDVKDAPFFRDIAKEVLAFIGDSDLGGFSIERFDLPVLEREIVNAGLRFEWRSRNIYDAQKVYHVNEKRDLMAAYHFYCNKKLHKAHSAMGDAEATLEILDCQLKRYRPDDDNIEALKGFDYDYSTEYFDKERKFRWWNGQLYPTFGKFGRKYSLKEIAQKDTSYLKWMLTQDFSGEVKAMIEGVLNGQFPEK